MEDTEALIISAQSKVSSTITALESAIATYDGMQNKPEQYADTIASMKKLLSRLEAWEKNSLKNSRAPTESKKKSLNDLITIADSSKGDF
ncbi:DUF4120 domain-containing protein [Candidatus Micrarchaeota archaeon]|nr:DUF4120 domain-containing protein [Candidatus Micrarchaeota archaeon]